MSQRVFIDRRRRQRRTEDDPCNDLPMDLYHRKRRKSRERRKQRTLLEDYYAFTGQTPEAETADDTID